MRLRLRHTLVFAFAASAFPARPLPAQALAPPIARWTNDFSRIGGVAELPDGRIVIVDNRDQTVMVGDAGGGQARALGRTGDGPNEYRRPFTVTRGLADTLLVYAQNRLVRIAPDGRLAGSIPFTTAALGGSVGPPRGVDQQGRIYWDRVVIRDPATGAIKRQQQYEIMRVDPKVRKVEIVTTASDHAPEMHEHRFHPFAERDAWVVEPDGAVRVVRAGDYLVETRQHGRVVARSSALSFQPTLVTGGDREAFRRDRAANPAGMSFGGRGGTPTGEVSPAAMARMRASYPDEMFPKTKPPFVEDGVLRSPGGQLWVIRSPTDASLVGSTIDVLDGAGRRIREIVLPTARRLIALDRRGVYLVHEDEDGLQFLERYGWPEGLR